MSGVEVHVTTEDGRLVVTVETDKEDTMLETVVVVLNKVVIGLKCRSSAT